MHISKFFQVFVVVSLCIFMPIFLFTYLNANLDVVNSEIHQKMDSASYSAMEEVTLADGKAFASDAQRTKVLNAFYGSLAAAFGNMEHNLKQITITSYIPCVILADTDGAYVCYGKDYQTWNSQTDAYAVTPITTYSVDYTSSDAIHYGVTFYMDGSASIRKEDVLLASDTFEGLKSSVPEEDLDNLPFMLDKNTFEQEKQATISNTLQRIAENYLNQGIEPLNGVTESNKHQVHYTVTFPKDSSFGTAPSIFCFFTGNQVSVGSDLSAQAIMSSATLGREPIYFVETRMSVNADGDEIREKYYHQKDCSRIMYCKKAPYTFSQLGNIDPTPIPCPDCIR